MTLEKKNTLDNFLGDQKASEDINRLEGEMFEGKNNKITWNN